MQSLLRHIGTIRSCRTIFATGRVVEITGIIIKASIPGIHIGEICMIQRRHREPLPAEVVGFRDDIAYLMPLGHFRHIGPDCLVWATGTTASVRCGNFLMGRIVDVVKNLQTSEVKREGVSMSIHSNPPHPMSRRRITSQLHLGVRALDTFSPIGIGQRLGIFAAAGTGKSTLLGMIARGASVDVNVVALIGERGREVREFVEDSLGAEGMKRSVVVVATSDEPALIRLKSAFVATSIAEYFRDRGKNVLLMMDSITRFARAQREVGLALGEPPARGGYPPSVYSLLPCLLERAGNSDKGSITALYTVLVAGDDLTEPIADEVMSILDGHVILSRKLAARGQYPAIDLLLTKSRVMSQIASSKHQNMIRRLLDLLAVYEENRDSIAYGFYQSGSDQRIDKAVRIMPALQSYLNQQEPELGDVTELCGFLESLLL